MQDKFPENLELEAIGDAECPFCHGYGTNIRRNNDKKPCSMCGGSGELVIISNIYKGTEAIVSPCRLMEEHHFQNIEDVGIAWDEFSGRVWVCINGECVFRSKPMKDKFLMEFNDPKDDR